MEKKLIRYELSNLSFKLRIVYVYFVQDMYSQLLSLLFYVVKNSFFIIILGLIRRSSYGSNK